MSKFVDFLGKYGASKAEQSKGYFNCVSLSDLNSITGVEIRHPEITSVELMEYCSVKKPLDCWYNGTVHKDRKTKVITYPLDVKFFNKKSVDTLYFVDSKYRDIYRTILLENTFGLLHDDDVGDESGSDESGSLSSEEDDCIKKN